MGEIIKYNDSQKYVTKNAAIDKYFFQKRKPMNIE